MANDETSSSGTSSSIPLVPPRGMSVADFRIRAKEMVDWIADYYENIEEFPVKSNVSPRYLRKMLSPSAPRAPEAWKDIIADIERTILPGITHWQSPRFHAYFPANTSFPALIADMFSNAVNSIGFNWSNSPAMTELEMFMMDWLVECLGLPRVFSSKSTGGGCIQGSASESVLCAVIAARERVLACFGSKISNMCAYISDQAHASFAKAFRIAGIRPDHIRVLKTSQEEPFPGSIDAAAFRDAVENDVAAGLRPIFVGTTLGTTAAAQWDVLEPLGPICQQFNIWMHVDAAYAGSALICPEHRHMMKGIDYANSFCFNPHKWLLTNFDCSALFVRSRNELTSALGSSMDIYQNKATSSGKVFDYRNWQIPLGRRFRALKLFFVIRCFGLEGLREHIRRDCRLATMFDDLVKADDRLEVVSRTHLGLVCFRLAPCDCEETLEDTNRRNQALVDALNADGQIFLVHSAIEGKYFLRFAVCSPTTESHHIHQSFRCIQRMVDEQQKQQQQKQQQQSD